MIYVDSKGVAAFCLPTIPPVIQVGPCEAVVGVITYDITSLDVEEIKRLRGSNYLMLEKHD